MKHLFHLGVALAFLGLSYPNYAVAQSDDNVSLGDFARALRQGREPAAPLVIDNDNLSRVMDEVENHRLGGSPLFSLNGSDHNFRMSSPDGTCSLSFNANATSLLTVPYVAEDLPQSELAKLDGPASINDDTLEITVYNGSDWNVKEVTVGLTIVRRTDAAASHGSARLLPAAVEESTPPAGKPSDLTLLLHLKGTTAPLGTTILREKLPAALAAGQEWHWAIVQAKGIPPRSALSSGLLSAPTN
jgi:hypothetical protein